MWWMHWTPWWTPSSKKREADSPLPTPVESPSDCPVGGAFFLVWNRKTERRSCRHALQPCLSIKQSRNPVCVADRPCHAGTQQRPHLMQHGHRPCGKHRSAPGRTVASSRHGHVQRQTGRQGKLPHHNDIEQSDNGALQRPHAVLFHQNHVLPAHAAPLRII